MFRLGLFALFLVALAATSARAVPFVNKSHLATNLSSTDSELALDRASSHQEVSVGFDFDVLGIAEAIAGAVSSSENRDAFVKNLAYTAFYQAGSQYNVMVFNLNVDHEVGFEGVKSYGSATYDGIVYGIWVFESGWFRNNGDGGYINWAFVGWFNRDEGYVSFR